MAADRTAFLLALLAGTVLGSGSALASGLQVTEPPPAAEDDTILFSADEVIQEEGTGLYIARGNVRAFRGEQAVVADQVTYDPQTELVVASGNVSIFYGQGQVYYADEVNLTGELQAGVAENFAAVIGRQTRITGASAVRRESGQIELYNASYTGCEVCRDDGSPKTPTWQVRAQRVVQDDEDGTVRFRNAFVQVLGVPVLYTPYLQMPDPSLKRKTGFLMPSVATSSRLGLEVAVPYYIAFSDYQDMTLTPRVFSEYGTLMAAEYRVRRHDAGLVIQAGVIDPNDLDPSDDGVNEDTPEIARWHFFGEAFKDFGPAWRLNADVDLVSDKGYLRFYDVEPTGDLREAVDILQPDRLESEIALTRLTDRAFTRFSGVGFQSLRFSEDNDYQADPVPRISHEQRFDMPGIGGALTVLGDALYLHRPDGRDTARAVASARYEKLVTTRWGHRLRSFAELRADTYHFEDIADGDETCNPVRQSAAGFEACRQLEPYNLGVDTASVSRVLPTIGAEWSYPLAKLTDGATFIVEPVVQAVWSPEDTKDDEIFDEDSAFFQFDTVTLFDWNKSSGFDRFEGGERYNVGLRTSAILGGGLSVSTMLGQQFRPDQDQSFEDAEGLGGQTSDIVGTLDFRLGRMLRWDNRFRIDDEDGSIVRGESALSARIGPLATNLSYVRAERAGLLRDEFLNASTTLRFNSQWLGGVSWKENLIDGETTNQRAILRYVDDCFVFTTTYRFDNETRDANTRFNENTSITFTLDVLTY